MADAMTVPSGIARPVDAYEEHAPPTSLASYIECFWSRTGAGTWPASPRSHRVLPDGCADVVIAFDNDTSGPAAAAVGTMTRPVLFTDTTRVSYVGARFRPGVAGALFRAPASELTDQRPELADVWPQIEPFTDALATTAEPGARLKILTAEIARRLLAAPTLPPPAVVAAAASIASSRGRLPIRSLAAQLGVSRQHLARSFAQYVGVSPKMLARIVRARSVVEMARDAADLDWVSVALDAGYYDQSHLIAEVRELTGLPPGSWLGARI
jgi:AraC-like DNA-binding protein